MKRSRFVLRSKAAPDLCPACGRQNGLLGAHKAVFDKHVAYTSGGLCTECNEKVAPYKADLEKGILVVCTHCLNMACVPYDDQSSQIIDALRSEAGRFTGFVLTRTESCPNCDNSLAGTP